MGGIGVLNCEVAVRPPPGAPPRGPEGGFIGPGRGVAFTPPNNSSKSSAAFGFGGATGVATEGGIGNEDPAEGPEDPPDIGLLKNCVNSLPLAGADGGSAGGFPPGD